MNMRYYFLTFSLVICLVGCGVRTPIKRELVLSKENVISILQQRSENIKTLKGKGTFTFESKHFSGSSSFSATLRKPDSLLIDFRGPFGIQLASLLVLRDRYIFYNRMEKIVVTGNPDSFMLSKILPVNISIDEMLAIFSGDFFNINFAESLDEFAIDDNIYLLKSHSSQNGIEYQVDAFYLIATSSKIFDSNGELIFNATASRLTNDITLPMPTLVRVMFPKENSNLIISYNEVNVNVDVICSLNIPEEVEIIYQ